MSTPVLVMTDGSTVIQGHPRAQGERGLYSRIGRRGHPRLFPPNRRLNLSGAAILVLRGSTKDDMNRERSRLVQGLLGLTHFGIPAEDPQ
jgi:hypothetical protein